MLSRTFFFGFGVAMLMTLALGAVSCALNGYNLDAPVDSYVLYPLIFWFILVGVLVFVEMSYFIWTGKDLNFEDRVLRKLGFQVDESVKEPNCGPFV